MKEKQIEAALGELGEMQCETLLRLKKRLFLTLSQDESGWDTFLLFEQLANEIEEVERILLK